MWGVVGSWDFVVESMYQRNNNNKKIDVSKIQPGLGFCVLFSVAKLSS